MKWKMENRKIGLIVCAVACVLFMGLVGCHNKKKIQPKQEVAESTSQQVDESTSKEQVTDSLGASATVPNLGGELDSSKLGGESKTTEESAVEPIVELVEEALEEEQVTDSLGASATPPNLGGELWRPQYQSAYGKGTVTIFYRQQRLSSPVVVTYIADSIIVASVQPMLGIEMYRLEALPDRARLFEKLNRRYVEMTYEEISAETKRTIDFPLVERMVEEVGLTYPIGQDTTLRYSGVEANLRLQYRTVNQPVSAFPISEYGYTPTNIRAILSK